MLAPPLPPPPPFALPLFTSVAPAASTSTFAPPAPPQQTMTRAQLAAAYAALPPLPQSNVRTRSIVSFIS
jgi:hypothetical protein